MGSKTADVALLGTYVPQRGLQMLQLSLSSTPGEALEALKQRKIQVFYCGSCIAAGAVQSAPGALQEQPKMAPKVFHELSE